MLRVLRALPATRRKLTPNVLRRLVATYYGRAESKQEREAILHFIEEPMDTDISAQGRCCCCNTCQVHKLNMESGLK